MNEFSCISLKNVASLDRLSDAIF